MINSAVDRKMAHDLTRQLNYIILIPRLPLKRRIHISSFHSEIIYILYFYKIQYKVGGGIKLFMRHLQIVASRAHTPFKAQFLHRSSIHLKQPILRTMASSSSDLGIESGPVKTATGVTLTDNQKTLVGSVLDVCAFACVSLPSSSAKTFASYLPAGHL